MTSALKQQIETQAFAVAEGVLDSEALSAIISDYDQLPDRLAPIWYSQGRISSAFSDLPFEERLTAVISDSEEDLFQHFDIALPNSTITPDTPIHISRETYKLLRNKRLLDKVEEVVGGEILSNPIQHVRIKPAQAKVVGQPSSLLKTTAWHQDQGVARAYADDTDMLTVWLAITDTTVENGCLQVVPYSHREGITLHCPLEALAIPDQLLAGEPLPVPIKAGDAIFMHRLTQHASLSNLTDSIRWSFDLRYQTIGVPTGRDEFPSLVVRSRSNPAQEQSYEEWRDSWYEARAVLAGAAERESTNRWDGIAALCT